MVPGAFLLSYCFSNSASGAARGYASCGVAFCRFLWYSLSRKALSNQTQAAIAPHRSRCLALRSKASAGGQLFGSPPDGPERLYMKVEGRDALWTTFGILLLLFQTIIATVGTSRKCQYHLMDDRKKDDSVYASRKTRYQSTKWQENDRPYSLPNSVAVITFCSDCNTE